mmetsp:Transcript_37693/g.93717  ORF Transcript_37693/g.93717 Transcript_37693/m.93717 type:complete len:280 (+) Transcript_37693:2108-2947(+)
MISAASASASSRAQCSFPASPWSDSCASADNSRTAYFIVSLPPFFTGYECAHAATGAPWSVGAYPATGALVYEYAWSWSSEPPAPSAVSVMGRTACVAAAVAASTVMTATCAAAAAAADPRASVATKAADTAAEHAPPDANGHDLSTLARGDAAAASSATRAQPPPPRTTAAPAASAARSLAVSVPRTAVISTAVPSSPATDAGRSDRVVAGFPASSRKTSVAAIFAPSCANPITQSSAPPPVLRTVTLAASLARPPTRVPTAFRVTMPSPGVISTAAG